MRFVNLTPHEITVWEPEFSGSQLNRTILARWSPSGTIARATEIEEALPPVDVVVFALVPEDDFGHYYTGTQTRQIPVSRRSYVLPVEGLPDPEDGVGYIVSQITAAAVPERTDVYFPGTAIRDGAGQIIGCLGLCQMAPAEGAGL